jgi:hypothetical protein
MSLPLIPAISFQGTEGSISRIELGTRFVASPTT